MILFVKYKSSINVRLLGSKNKKFLFF